MKRNVVLSVSGNNSFFRRFLGKNDNFDLIILFYENDEKVFDQLKSEGFNIYKCNGEKWNVLHKFFLDHNELFDKYDNFWFPDDDILIDSESINILFNLHSLLDLWISQPSILGYTSHDITKHDPSYVLRYTNFVEIMCPLMSCNTLKFILNTFNLNESGWALDFLWPKLLNFPKDRIAIIDYVQAFHTRKAGSAYSRFKSRQTPHQQADFLMKMFSMNHKPNNIQGVRV